jgi:hypothetical protein
MAEQRGKTVAPSIKETAFSCPHCGALAKQFWFSVHADRLDKDSTPNRLTPVEAEEFIGRVKKDMANDEAHANLAGWARKMGDGAPFIDHNNAYRSYDAYNVSFSECFNCNRIAVWINDRLTWPTQGEGPLPNPDMPDDVRRDFEEAGLILNLSPRGAAALLRLSIQRLCAHLGEAGENINDDISSLVKKGLDLRVQQALDVVRVVGNNAVHPGQMDLQDDRATAEKLFGLANLIVEIMISQPQHIASMFANLPEGARIAIEKRDAPKK